MSPGQVQTGGQVFLCIDDLKWQWEEVGGISGVPGIFAFIKYDNAVYAGTNGYKGVFRLPLKGNFSR